jgi:hypothetical protein
MVEESHSSHGRQKAKRGNRKGPGNIIEEGHILFIHFLQLDPISSTSQ